MRRICIVFCALLMSASVVLAAEGKKKVVLVAGKDSHGRGEHEFRAGMILLANALKENAPDIEPVLTFDGWPKDNALFDGAAAIVIYCDGGNGHPIRQQWDFVEGLLKKGVGLGCMHYGVEIPAGEGGGDRFLSWIGGFYESGFSINPHWSSDLKVAAGHPVTRGVKGFNVRDEWYFNIHFPENKQGWTSILEGVPDDEARSGKTSWPRGPKPHIVGASGRSETLMWTVERPDGGRGYGFTGGHFHKNWANDDQRKLILNAVLWIAKAEVPEGGVNSKTPTPEQMEANLKEAKKK